MSLVGDVFEFVKQYPGLNGMQIQNKLQCPYISSSIEELETNGCIRWEDNGYYPNFSKEINDVALSLEDAIDAVSKIVKESSETKCPHCELTVKGEINIEKFFGFGRCNGKTIPQSCCRECRYTKSKVSNINATQPITFHSIEEAKNMRTGINVQGIIIKKEPSRLVITRTGDAVRVCTAYLGNDLGQTIKITIWGNDTQRVKNGTKIRIVNGYTTHYHYMNETSISAGKYGQLIILENAKIEKPKIFRKKIINEPSQFDNDNWIIDESDIKKSSFLSFDSKNEFKTKVDDFKF